MIIKTITVSESIETIGQFGLKKWKKTEMCADIVEGEDELMRSLELHKKAEEINKIVTGSNELQTIESMFPASTSAPPIIDRRKQDIKDFIAESQTQSELEKHFPDALKYGLKDEYNKRLKELSWAVH